MSTLLTIPQIGIKHAKKQPELVDAITEDTPALKRFLWQESSHGLWNLAEVKNGVQGASFVPMDSPLPDMSVDSELKKIDLSIMGGNFEVGRDKATQYGGKDKYLADNLTTVYAESGMSAEKAVLYNKIKAAAVHYKKLVFAQDDSATGTYTILAMRMKRGENSGLYDSKMFNQGTLLQTTPLNGGNHYKNSKGVVVYGWTSVGYFGWQTLVDDACAAIVNVDTSHPPTGMMIDDMLELAKYDKSGTVMIVASSQVRPLINDLKRDKLQITSSEKGVDFQLDNWNGVPIVYTRNMLSGTETAIAKA